MMKTNKSIVVVAAMLLMSGCASMRDSLILGAGVGGATGAAAGVLTSSAHRGKGALIGGLIGGAIGTISSYFMHKGIESHDSKLRKETLFSLEKFGVSEVPSQSSSVPAISFSVAEEQKVETHRQGNRVIEGHRIWILSDDSNVQYNGRDSQLKRNDKK